ncbi:MAG: oxidoreductase [Elusimicrobia bacterium]|nr:oxidoreductase [Elusimicrobiota bacterium]
MTPPETINAVLLEKTEIAPGIKTFVFRPERRFEYIAGQFAFWGFEKDGRSYSKPFTISSSPSRDNIEFTTIVSSSDYKAALDGLRPGHAVKVRGPMGMFTLDSLRRDIICYLAGGIGITPVISMLRFAYDTGMDIRGTLFYSNRDSSRIVFEKELDVISGGLGRFNTVHTLTEAPEGWGGEKGYIDADMIKKHCPDYSGAQFYIVGPPAFNTAMGSMLKNGLDIKEEYITLENFAGY